MDVEKPPTNRMQFHGFDVTHEEAISRTGNLRGHSMVSSCTLRLTHRASHSYQIRHGRSLVADLLVRAGGSEACDVSPCASGTYLTMYRPHPPAVEPPCCALEDLAEILDRAGPRKPSLVTRILSLLEMDHYKMLSIAYHADRHGARDAIACMDLVDRMA
jgi:hypothetical protein